MSLLRNWSAAAVTPLLFLFATTFAADNKVDSATIMVKCANGQSINKALENTAKELLIEIRGICNESVVIRRNRVTLRGNDPAFDGIRAQNNDVDFIADSAVSMLNAYLVSLENLQLTNGAFGLVVDYSTASGMSNMLIKDNQLGMFQRSSAFGISDTTFTNNQGGGALVRGASTWSCSNCNIVNNPGSAQGVVAAAITGRDASILNFSDSQISGDAFGVRITNGSLVTISGTNSIIAVPENTEFGYPCCAALSGSWDSNFNIGAGQTIEGPIDIYGGKLHIRTGNQTIGAAWDGAVNLLRATDARLVTGGNLQAFNLAEFATLYIQGTAQVSSLNCETGADAWCSDPNVNVSGLSNCGQCTKP